MTFVNKNDYLGRPWWQADRKEVLKCNFYFIHYLKIVIDCTEDLTLLSFPISIYYVQSEQYNTPWLVESCKDYKGRELGSFSDNYGLFVAQCSIWFITLIKKTFLWIVWATFNPFPQATLITSANTKGLARVAQISQAVI